MTPKLGSGQRFEHLTHQLAGKGIRDPKALAATIGRNKYGAKKMAAMAQHGKGYAEGGMVDGRMHDCPNCNCEPDSAVEGSVVPAPHAMQEEQSDGYGQNKSASSPAGESSFHARWAKSQRSRR